MLEERFDAPMERTIWWSTMICYIVTAAAVILLLGLRAELFWVRLVIAMVLVLSLCVSYLFSPRGYSVGRRGVVVHRPIADLVIPHYYLLDVWIDPHAASPRAIRLFGSGGFHGDYGWFWSKELGYHIRYVTDRSRAVVVKAKRTYVLSPDDPQRFLSAVKDVMTNTEYPF